jgi:hypothetical protein
MPLPIQNPRISQQVHEAYNVVGRYRAQIDEVVVPVALVDDLTHGAGSFPVVRRAAGRFGQAAVVGEFCTFRFETPPGILGVIRRIVIRPGAAGALNILFGSTIPAPAGTADKAFIDGRVRNRGETPAGVLSFGTQVAALANTHYIINAAVTNAPFEVEWPIGQVGAFDFCEFQWGAANQTVTAGLSWDEYLIRP